MEVSINEDGRPAEQANILMVISNAIQHALTWINWFFSMTKIDRFNAGIDTSGEGREE